MDRWINGWTNEWMNEPYQINEWKATTKMKVIKKICACDVT